MRSYYVYDNVYLDWISLFSIDYTKQLLEIYKENPVITDYIHYKNDDLYIDFIIREYRDLIGLGEYEGDWRKILEQVNKEEPNNRLFSDLHYLLQLCSTNNFIDVYTSLFYKPQIEYLQLVKEKQKEDLAGLENVSINKRITGKVETKDNYQFKGFFDLSKLLEQYAKLEIMGLLDKDFNQALNKSRDLNIKGGEVVQALERGDSQSMNIIKAWHIFIHVFLSIKYPTENEIGAKQPYFKNKHGELEKILFEPLQYIATSNIHNKDLRAYELPRDLTRLSYLYRALIVHKVFKQKKINLWQNEKDFINTADLLRSVIHTLFTEPLYKNVLNWLLEKPLKQ